MGSVSRPSKEKIELSPCPFCEGDVTAHDCGYTTFNPGWAKCSGCGRKWEAGWVEDSWQVAVWWNRYAIQAKAIEKAEKRLEKLKAKANTPKPGGGDAEK